jgi:hypothetical protein
VLLGFAIHNRSASTLFGLPPILEESIMRNRKTIIVVAFLCLALPALTGSGEPPKSDKDKMSALMRKKLEHSQKVLEGIATQDYKMISSSAEELVEISKEAEWKSAVKTPRYEVHSNDFRRQAEEMIKAAREKNVDAAAVGYVEMTLTCVKCHKHVREERMTSFQD